MDSIIVETLRRDGGVVGRFRCEGERLCIGRAYDNDVILDDPYVSPHHAEIRADGEGCWRAHDRDSVNGTRHGLAGPVTGSQALASGDELELGRSRLRVIFPDHEVEPTLKESPQPRWVSWLDRPAVALALLAAAAAVNSYMQLLQSGQMVRWVDLAATPVTGLLLALGWAGTWSIVGRVTKHRHALAGQCSAVALAWLAINLLTQLTGYVQFWSDGQWPARVLSYGGGALLGGGLIYASLVLATQLRWSRALVTAQAVSWALLLALVLTEIAQRPAFDPEPDYAAALEPPIFGWQPAEDREAFSEAVEATFDDLERASPTPKDSGSAAGSAGQ